MSKHLTLLILSFILPFYIFGQDTTYFDANWEKTTPGNAHYLQIQKKTNKGIELTDLFASNNRIQMQGTYLSKDLAVKTGVFKWYFENGQLKHIGEYKNNEEIGTHTWYQENGKVEAIENYKKGQLDGEYKEFHEDGKPAIETTFSSGIQNGWTIHYRENGLIHSEGNFKDGDYNGVWKYYDEKGELLGTNTFQTDYDIEEAKMFLQLPNSDWELQNKTSNESVTNYQFSRAPIIDKDGVNIIPSIIVFIEDATAYNQDVTLYTINKQIPFKDKGVKIEQTLIQSDKNFPLEYKNAFFIKSSYSADGMDHILYMIHFITKENKGVQIYLDMTKSIADDYEAEFWKTIKSIKVK